jgi:hypothetical protein
MKTLLRTSGLAAVLAFAAFTAGSAAFPPQYVTCHAFCSNFSTHSFYQASWQSTVSECCSGTFNPCPAGYSQGSHTYTTAGGNLAICIE